MGENDLDRKLEQAAARSPEVAAMLAGRHDDPSARYRRLFLAALGIAVGVGGAWLAASSFGGRSGAARPHEPAEEIDTSKYLAPIKTETGGAGEQVAPFEGFAVSVDTAPPGAVVTITGVVRGEAPVLAGVACKPGEDVEISARHEGFPPVRRKTLCRADTLVKLKIRVGQ